MGIYEKAEALIDALLDTAKQSLELLEDVRDFLDDLALAEEEEDEESQPVHMTAHIWAFENDGLEFFDRAVDALETLVAAVGGRIIPVDALERFVEEWIGKGSAAN